MKLKMTLQKASVIFILLLTGCSALYVVNEKNKSQFSTAELCVYAYDYQNLPMWAHDEGEWGIITGELKARGINDKNGCNSFNFALRECENQKISDKDLLATCVQRFSNEFDAERARVFAWYDQKGKNFNSSLDSFSRQQQSYINSLQQQQMQNRILRCTSTPVGSTINTTCY
jgi:hypothetical protein